MSVTLRPMSWNQDTDLIQWFMDLGNSTPRDKKEGTRSIIVLTIWEIWKERNNRIFMRSNKMPEQLFNAIREEVKLWIRAGNRALESLLPPAMQLLVVVPNGPQSIM